MNPMVAAGMVGGAAVQRDRMVAMAAEHCAAYPIPQGAWDTAAIWRWRQALVTNPAASKLARRASSTKARR